MHFHTQQPDPGWLGRAGRDFFLQQYRRNCKEKQSLSSMSSGSSKWPQNFCSFSNFCFYFINILQKSSLVIYFWNRMPADGNAPLNVTLPKAGLGNWEWRVNSRCRQPSGLTYICFLKMCCQIAENSVFQCEKFICGPFTMILLPSFILFTVTFLHSCQFHQEQWEAGASY